MNNTNNDKNTYPAPKIILYYVLFGGFIGGFLSVPAMVFINIDQHDMSVDHLTIQYIVENILPWFGILPMVGILWGLIPALITSIFIVRGRIYITNFKAYLDIFLLGCSVTFCCFAWIWAMGGGWQSALFLAQLVISGGLSSVIVGHFVIPKQKSL